MGKPPQAFRHHSKTLPSVIILQWKSQIPTVANVVPERDEPRDESKPANTMVPRACGVEEPGDKRASIEQQ